MNTPPFTIEKLALPGVLRITLALSRDARGSSSLTYHTKAFAVLGVTTHFVQDYTSYSARHVIRGLHFQAPPHAQDKLVRCSQGEIFDVVADRDPRSSTYGRHVSTVLTGALQSMLFIPGHYAHGFCVISDGAMIEYKMSEYYHPESASGVRYDDPTFTIAWPVSNPILSEQDTQWPLLQRLQN